MGDFSKESPKMFPIRSLHEFREICENISGTFSERNPFLQESMYLWQNISMEGFLRGILKGVHERITKRIQQRFTEGISGRLSK